MDSFEVNGEFIAELDFVAADIGRINCDVHVLQYITAKLVCQIANRLLIVFAGDLYGTDRSSADIAGRIELGDIDKRGYQNCENQDQHGRGKDKLYC